MALIDIIYKFLPRLRIGFSSFVVLMLLINPVLAQETPEIKQEAASPKGDEQETPENLSVDSFEDPYLVEAIEADATADNAVMAREKAFEAAQIRGYEELAKRFLSEDELAEFEVPDLEKIEPFVQDFEVTNEQLSLTRYKGVYNIRYAKNTFKKAKAGGVDNETPLIQQTELLVLPFFEVNDRYYLWQINPFWEAWKRAQSNKETGKIAVPAGSVEDVSAIRDGQGLRYDPASLNAMGVRYKAKNVALVVARPETFDDGIKNIAVTLYNAKPYGPELSKQFSVRAYPGELQEQLYGRVVATVTQELHARWERITAVPQNGSNLNGQAPIQPQATVPLLSGESNNLIAQLRFSSPRQWVETKKAIEAIRGVDTLQIKSLSSQSATIGINFLGSVDALRSALFKQGVRLNNAPSNGVYELMPVRR